MNINSIQTGQISQSVIKSSERSGSSIENRTRSVSISAENSGSSYRASETAIAAGIDFLQEQLHTLLTSFPPFFPAGSYQRADLIRGIKSLEEQIGKSAVDENLKKLIFGNKLSEDASDAEISDSLDRLSAVRENIVAKKPTDPEPIHSGSLLSIKI